MKRKTIDARGRACRLYTPRTEVAVNRAARKQGIALVVVLGFLSVMVLMAVSFAIIMRTERLSSRNYTDQVRARQLVHAALARITGDHIRSEMEGLVYPPWDATRSQHDGRVGPDFITAGIGDGWAYIPKALEAAADAANVAEWKPLRDPVDDSFYGEYAYLVVNNSGLLDANFVRGGGARSDGYSPGEIRATPTVLAEMNNDSLLAYRDRYKRFESIPELYWLCIDSTVGLPRCMNIRPDFYVDNFHIYSRYPRGYAPPPNLIANTNVAHIGGPTNQWSPQAVIEAALQDLQPNPIANVRHFVNALYDYATGGVVPHGATDDERYRRFSAKAVPMINEIAIRNTARLTASVPGTNTIEHKVYVITETWYPFPVRDPDGTSFRIRYTATPTVRFQTRYGLIEQPTAGSGLSVNSVTHDRFDYRTATNVYTHVVTTPAGVGDQYQITVLLAGNFEVVSGGGSVADRVYGPWGDTVFRSPRAALPALPLNEEIVLGELRAVSANDPRINWDAGSYGGAAQWDLAAATLGAPNLRLGAGGASLDELGFMYARRGPLRSVGEVGYLLYDAEKPWTTVRLMGPDDDGTAAIMDRLTVYNTTFRQGMVNINTRQTNALAAVFHDMPIKTHPEANSVGDLSAENAKRLAVHTYNRNQTLGPMANYSDIATRWESAGVAGELGLPTTNKFLLDSVVRHSMGLWGTRHNLFTVFLAARVFSELYDPVVHGANADNYVVGEQRAVAVVWRDPYITEDPLYPEFAPASNESFVRFFHWLVLLFDD